MESGIDQGRVEGLIQPQTPERGGLENRRLSQRAIGQIEPRRQPGRWMRRKVRLSASGSGRVSCSYGLRGGDASLHRLLFWANTRAKHHRRGLEGEASTS